MKFICKQKEILEAVKIAGKTTSKMSKGILECILITSTADGLVLKATDTQSSIVIDAAAQILEEGQIAVPSNSLINVISKYPNEEVAFETENANSLKISCNKSKTVLRTMNVEEFPLIIEVDRNQMFQMRQGILKKMISKTSFCVAANESKPILTGLFFDLKTDRLSIVALDGYRMAVATEEILSSIETKCVIPGKAATEVMRLLKDGDETVKIMIDRNAALFQLGSLQFVTRLLDGEYIKYENLLPKKNATCVEVDTVEFCDAIDRVSVITNTESNKLIRIAISDGAMIITSMSEVGTAEDECRITKTGNDLQIGYNARYWIEMLRNIEKEKITLWFDTPNSPCLVFSECKYLILPVQIRG